MYHISYIITKGSVYLRFDLSHIFVLFDSKSWF